MPVDPSLVSSLTCFAHIARHRSFTRAATEMGVTRAALSQQLKGLERRLNTRLLNRTTREMSLTEEGVRLLDVLQPALKSLAETLDVLSESPREPSGLIRLNTPRLAARWLIEPHLGEFLARYPKVRLELILDDGFSNIVADGVDAGIRLGRSLDEHRVAVPITPPLTMAIVASPGYFDRHGIPTTPADLTAHNCLAYRFTSSGRIDSWSFRPPDDDTNTLVFEPRGNLVFNDDDSMLRAALQGVGVIQHIELCVRQHLAKGRLKRVLAPWCHPFPGFHLYVSSRAQMPAKIRALISFLREKRTALLAGDTGSENPPHAVSISPSSTDSSGGAQNKADGLVPEAGVEPARPEVEGF